MNRAAIRRGAVASLLCLGLLQSAAAAINFEDRTAASGLTTALYAGYGSAWGDFNGDGRLDVWIGNHMYQPGLYLNQGGGTFANITGSAWSGDPLLDAHGAAWADFDNDGDQDMAELSGVNMGTSSHKKYFFVNRAGVLVDESQARGLNDTFTRGRTPLWLDWNNDGRLDLYLANLRRPEDLLSPRRLMLQQPDGSFAELAGMTRQLDSTLAQLAYFDNAVHLVVQDATAYPIAVHRIGQTASRPIVLQPNTKITDVVDVAVADFDGDLSDDLFALRARTELSTFVLDPATRRQVDTTVADSGVAGGLNYTFNGPNRIVLRVYGADWAREQVRVGAAGARSAAYVRESVQGRSWRLIEVTLDGANAAARGLLPAAQQTAPGIYVGRTAAGQWQLRVRGASGIPFRARVRATDTAFSSVNATGFSTTAFALQPALLFRRGAAFRNEASTRGLTTALPCTSVAAGDFDNDMDVDVYLACTDILGNRANILLENTGTRFVVVANAGGAGTENIGTGGFVSVADYDNDGYLDLLVTDGAADIGYPYHFGRRFLLHNQGGANHWLRVVLVGCSSNRDGIGARVVISAGGRQQARLKSGSVRMGVQDDSRLHFGLAGETSVQSLVVTWPSGTSTTLTNLPADQTHTIREDAACSRP
jgi:ASPIC and UnbV/FG-GAP-like repeat